MIIAAAIAHDGVIYSLPAPARHHDIIAYIAAIPGVSLPVKGGDAQGFMDHERGFVQRWRAGQLAKIAGQIAEGRSLHPSGRLFSEDLW